MNLNGRRRSTNVDDRRGQRGGSRGLIGGGIVGIIVALVAAFGGSDLANIVGQLAGGLGGTTSTQSSQPYVGSAEEEQLADFSKQIMAATEDVWSEIFRQNNMEYEPPKLVLYTGSTTSGCGNADSSIGPFYCSADESVYIDLSFFQNMRQTLGADGDFTYAYVIAHEVGHHVQHLLGTLEQTHARMQRLPESQANKLSVALELQADFYAGIWAHYDNQRFNSLEEGDIEEAIDAAQKIGDDYLQRRAQGYTVPDSFNHGTSEQRSRWLRTGVTTGNLALASKTFDEAAPGL